MQWVPTVGTEILVAPPGLRLEGLAPGLTLMPGVQLLDAPAGSPRWRVREDRPGLFDGRLCCAENSRWIVRTGPDVTPTASGGLSRLAAGVWEWSLDAAAGQAWLEVDRQRLKILVLPTKLPELDDDPLRALEVMILSLWRRHSALLRRLGRPSAISLGPGDQAERTPLQSLLVAHGLLEGGVRDAWLAIRARPHSELKVEYPIRPGHECRRPVLVGTRGPWSLPRGMAPDGQVLRARDRRPRRTLDTAPNRLAVALACQLADVGRGAMDALSGRDDGAAESWRTLAEQVRQAGLSFASDPHFADVSSIPPADLSAPSLLMHAAYRQIARGWRTLHRDLAPGLLEPLLQDPLKQTWDLYEYWCWLATIDAFQPWVLPGAQSLAHTDTEPDPEGHAFDDGRRVKHGLVWEGVSRRGQRVRLHYNSASGAARSYSRAFRRDLLLEISTGGMTRRIVLDAKYRRALDDTETGHSQTLSDDIKAMHAYRDALEGIEWALVLYPGTRLVLYPRRFPKQPCGLEGLAFGGVGAIPLAVGFTGHLERLAWQLLAP